MDHELRRFVKIISQRSWYVACILIWSYATNTADEHSDYDLRVIVEWEEYGTGFELSTSGKIIHYNIIGLHDFYLLSHDAFKNGRRRFFLTYSKAIILDQKDNRIWEFIKNLDKDIDLRTYASDNLFQQHLKNRDIQNNLEKIIKKGLLNSEKLYDKVFVDQVLVDLFNRYAGEIGYDRYLDLWWRSKAEKRLYDQNYAEANHGWLFPDMEFVQLREKVYGTRSMEIFNQLLEHIRSKIEKKEKLPILYANER